MDRHLKSSPLTGVATRRLLRSLIAATLLSLGISLSPANAVTVNYSVATSPDTNCAVQSLGGTATCHLQGGIALGSAGFGTTQLASASLSLFINGSLHDTVGFVAYDPDPSLPCTDYCAEVTTSASGQITDVNFFGTHSYLLGRAVSLSLTGWSWDSAIPQNGVFSGASGVSIVRQPPSPVPLPAGLFLLGTSLLTLGAFAFRSGQRRPRQATP